LPRHGLIQSDRLGFGWFSRSFRYQNMAAASALDAVATMARDREIFGMINTDTPHQATAA
jgi:hypothetical protein